MKLIIKNQKEVDLFFNQHFGMDCISIKGKPPEGATYSDGDLIERDINVGWKCLETGETVDIIYETEV